MLKVFIVLLTAQIWLLPNAAAQDFEQFFTGAINGKYKISMLIKKEGFSARGTYRYDRIGEDIYLAGSITKEGSLEMKEFTKEGKHTGTFTGFLNGGVFVGVWKSGDGKKQLPFSLKETTLTTKQKQEKSEILDAMMLFVEDKDERD
jgi:hypothetical protein